MDLNSSGVSTGERIDRPRYQIALHSRQWRCRSAWHEDHSS
jgi:hypothetical protein